MKANFKTPFVLIVSLLGLTSCDFIVGGSNLPNVTDFDRERMTMLRKLNQVLQNSNPAPSEIEMQYGKEFNLHVSNPGYYWVITTAAKGELWVCEDDSIIKNSIRGDRLHGKIIGVTKEGDVISLKPNDIIRFKSKGVKIKITSKK